MDKQVFDWPEQTYDDGTGHSAIRLLWEERGWYTCYGVNGGAEYTRLPGYDHNGDGFGDLAYARIEDDPSGQQAIWLDSPAGLGPLL